MLSLTMLGRWLVGLGVALVIIGGILWLMGKLPFLQKLGHLPGDIVYQSRNKRIIIAFPIVTSLLLSLLLTIRVVPQ